MWCSLFLICWDPAAKCSLMVVGPWRNQGLALRGENQSAALHATDTYQNLSIKESSVCLSLWSMHDHWISYHCWYWFWSQFAWSLDFLPFMILIRKMSDYIISLSNTDTKKRSYCWSKNCQKRWVLRPVLKAEKGCGSCEHEGELVTWHFCQSTMSSNVDQGKTQFVITKHFCFK